MQEVQVEIVPTEFGAESGRFYPRIGLERMRAGRCYSNFAVI